MMLLYYPMSRMVTLQIVPINLTTDYTWVSCLYKRKLVVDIKFIKVFHFES